jgi:predicted MPP superfamily phosphohydrolase
MLTPPGMAMRIGAGSLMFRYLWGQYWQGRSALFVNAGVGNWFPVRINAPAEIVQIHLV